MDIFRLDADKLLVCSSTMALLGGNIINLSMQQLLEEEHFSRTLWFLKYTGRL